MLSQLVASNADLSSETKSEHAFLLAELSRVEIYFRLSIAQLQMGRHPGTGGLVITDEDVALLLDGKTSGEPQPSFKPLMAQKQAESDALLAKADVEPRLAALYRTFNLDSFERDMFLICLAPMLDRRFERLLGYLQDDVTLRRPTVSGVLELLVDTQESSLQALRYFFEDAKLFSQRLLVRVSESASQTSLLNQQLAVDESILAWLLGVYQPDPRLETALRFTVPGLAKKDYLLTSEIWPVLADAINGQSVAAFHGSDWQVQLSTARRLAVNADMSLLLLDLSMLKQRSDVTMLESLRLALRDARMTESLLLVQHWDEFSAQTPGHEEGVRLLFSHPAPVIVSGEKEWYARGVERSDAILRIAFTRPSYGQRKEIWAHFIEECEHAFAAEVDVPLLASQFTLDSTQIADAISSARDAAIQRGDEVQQRDLVNAARIHSSPNLAGLARKIEPRYEWTDIVLPEDQKAMLREMIQTVRGRGIVMESWGVGAKLKTSSGVTVLFAGPPGTGKTMSAEVIAGELGLDLYKIDLSVVVSKYIGETEKNLGKIFDEAQSSSAVLFFDEADSIFGKRSEVKDSHDRYANMEISYLLQRMELYDGITILATNLRANMDDAFTRRMQFVVDFPFPDVEERLHIWRTLFPDELPRSGEIDLALLATRFKLAGGNIRNIIAGAAFLAAADGGAVTMTHLLHSTRRELQKMGRLISDVDLTF